MADEELVINIDDEEQHTTDGGPEKNEAVEDLKSQFANVQEQAKADRERAEAAERRAAQAAQEANRAREEVRTARSEVADRELDTIVSGIAAAQAEAAQAESVYEAAVEAGDFRRMAEANRRIARAEAKLGRLDEAKADIEVRRSDSGRDRGDTTRGRVEARPEQRQPPADPVEAFIATRDPDTQKWLRDHPDDARALIMDPNSRRARKLSAAHADAVAEGYREGSAEYFRHVESFVGLAKKDQANGQNGSGERQRRSSAPAAPVSNAAGGNSAPGGGTEVRLSAGETAAARDGTVVWNPGNLHPKTGQPIKHDDPLVGQPIGTREFAKRKLAMQRQGAYSNFLTEQ